MSNKLQKDINRYIKNISKQIPKNYPNKSALMNMIIRNLDNFLLEYPQSTIDDIVEEFGSPSKIAASFIEELSDTDIVAAIQKKHRSYTFAFIAFFVCFIIFLFTLQYIYNWYQNDALILEETLYVTDGTEFPTEWQEKFENEEIEDVYKKDID